MNKKQEKKSLTPKKYVYFLQETSTYKQLCPISHEIQNIIKISRFSMALETFHWDSHSFDASE